MWYTMQQKMSLMELIHIKGRQLYIKIVLLPSEKGSTLKGKNLLPVGANSFLLD